jgi:NAD(P)-dependent dehydrogenase (short-subunit alcohol dehydrogenase family)
MTKLLHNKVAIVYGAGGGIGSAVARTFASEGARVFLAGRTRESLDAVAADIASEGGSSTVTVLDALDEQAVDDHARSVVAQAGRIDISFNLISRGDVQGIPLVDMTAADLTRPVITGLTANFLTARAAARQMTKQGSGVIMTLTSGSSTATGPARARAADFHLGGTGPADAATETLTRYLAAELGPHGIRVLGLWTPGVSETLATDFAHRLAELATLRRLPTLAQVARTAAFLASDQAGAITGAMINASCGLVAD